MAGEPRKRRGTSTSSFGVSRRENHDASAFYERFVAPDVSGDDTVSPRRDIDDIFVGDARDMTKVDDASVALVVTSPPYFAGKDYETALGEGHVPATYADYLGMLEAVFAECVRTLEPGGRMAINVANLGRRPYRSLAGDVTWILQDRLRLLLRGEVVWVKARGAAGNCAWGSFQRPGNPVIRDLTERVVIASKGRFDRAVPAAARAAAGLPSEPTVTRDEFMEATTDIWEIPAESASRVGHPAPFPVALPERLIHLYTYRGDLVLDPFMGSGTTAVAAVRTGRRYVGYDTDAAYVAAAKARLAGEHAMAPPVLPAGVASSTRHAAEAAIEAAGFVDVVRNLRPPGGADLPFAATDAAGRRWWFDVAGAFTTSPSGLRHGGTLWRAIGRAAALHHADPDARLVLFTTDLPTPRSAGATALASVTGPGKPVHDVVVLTQPDDLARLAALATAPT